MGNIPGEKEEPDGSRDAGASAFDDVARVTDSGEAEGRFSSSAQVLRRPGQFSSRTKTLRVHSSRYARNGAGTDVSSADVRCC